MEWIHTLFFGSGIGHSILLVAIVIFIGIYLGKVKIAGVSLGITWILFVGIIFSHWGMRMDAHALHFLKEFGLILFVYSVGLQVGPGFFASFKKGAYPEFTSGIGDCIGCCNYLCFICRYRFARHYDGGYSLRGGDEYAGPGGCATGLFRYDR